MKYIPSEIDILRDKCETFHLQLLDINSDRERLINENDSLILKNEELTQTVANERAARHAQSLQHIANERAAHDAQDMRNKLTKVTSEHNALKMDYTLLYNSYKDVKSIVEKIKADTKTKNELQAQLDQLQSECNKLKNELAGVDRLAQSIMSKSEVSEYRLVVSNYKLNSLVGALNNIKNLTAEKYWWGPIIANDTLLQLTKIVEHENQLESNNNNTTQKKSEPTNEDLTALYNELIKTKIKIT